MTESKRVNPWLAAFYCLLNTASSCGIVFANKVVFSTFSFNFVTTLVLCHTIFTWAGMHMMEKMGFFQAKPLPWLSVSPLALTFVGYVVLGNASLSLNTVGFYQLAKIMIGPTVLLLEYLLLGKVQPPKVIASIAVLCFGIAIATVTDTVAIKNSLGLIVAVLSMVVTALYQIYAATKQKELDANSNQLLAAYTPQAIAILAIMVPFFDTIGDPNNPQPGTLLGYDYNFWSVGAIFLSSILGIMVTLSTFLFIGATSTLTFQVVSHGKTLIILAGGVLLFGDSMSWKKAAGIALAMTGVVWYSWLKMTPSVQAEPKSPPAKRSPPTTFANPIHQRVQQEDFTLPLLRTGSATGSGSSFATTPRAAENGEGSNGQVFTWLSMHSSQLAAAATKQEASGYR